MLPAVTVHAGWPGRPRAGRPLRQRALAGSVRAHDGMDLTRAHAELDPSQNLVFADRSPQCLDFEHHPTLPSRLTPSSFCASTANSIGSSLKTSLQKPLTIIEMAFSVLSPRCLQ